MRSRVAALVAALTLALTAQTAQAGPALGPTDGTAGIGDRYFPQDGNGGYDVRHYAIHDGWLFGQRNLYGWTRVTATAKQTLTSFHLDLMLPVRGVTVNGTKARFSKPSRHELVVRPATSIAAGDTFKVRVTYAGKPGQGDFDLGGIYHSATEVLAANQPHVAAYWFPANDHPRDKATFDISLTVPRDRRVVANGRLTGRTTKGTNTTWHWSARDPMATYLAFFAAGDYRISSGVKYGRRWTNAVSRNLTAGQQRRATALLDTTPWVVNWLTTQLGPYPFETTGGLVTSLHRGFALENQTRPTYDFWGGAEQIGVVVHEQAHQWYGDSVAVRNWRDIWLNEGFATFMEWRWAEAKQDQDAQETLLILWKAFGPDDSIWSVEPGSPGKQNIFSESVYVRGAMTLQALRHRIGERDFWTLMRQWAAEHRGGNASVPVFIAKAEAVSGEDLTGFFDAWLYTAGRPAKTAANGLDGQIPSYSSAQVDRLTRSAHRTPHE